MTTEEKDLIVQEVLNEIAAQSSSLDELPTATSLAQTESLPAYKKDTTSLIKVPISLISQPATTAADKANTAANSANNATLAATNATAETKKATEKATQITEEATEVIAEITAALETINSTKEVAERADSVSSSLKTQLKEYKIETPTERDYNDLESKDENTLYFCIEAEDI